MLDVFALLVLLVLLVAILTIIALLGALPGRIAPADGFVTNVALRKGARVTATLRLLP